MRGSDSNAEDRLCCCCCCCCQCSKNHQAGTLFACIPRTLQSHTSCHADDGKLRSTDTAPMAGSLDDVDMESDFDNLIRSLDVGACRRGTLLVACGVIRTLECTTGVNCSESSSFSERRVGVTPRSESWQYGTTSTRFVSCNVACTAFTAWLLADNNKPRSAHGRSM